MSHTERLGIYNLIKQRRDLSFQRSVNQKFNPMGESLLYAAVRREDTDMLQFLLAQPTLNPNKGNGDETPLVKASRSPNSECAKLLLTHPRIDVNRMSRYTWPAEISRGGAGGTALFFAANWGRAEILKALLEREDIEVDKGTHDGDSPFLDCIKRYLECMYPNEIELQAKTQWITKEKWKRAETEFKELDDFVKVRQEDQAKRREKYYECLLLFTADNRVKDIDRVYTLLRDLQICIEKTYETLSAQPTAWYIEEGIRKRKWVLSRISELLELLQPRNPVYDSVLLLPSPVYTMNEPSFHQELESILRGTGNGRRYVEGPLFWYITILQRLNEAYIQRRDGVNAGEIQTIYHSWSELDFSQYNGDTLLIRACHAEDMAEVVRLLSHPQIDVNKMNLQTRESPLTTAVHRGNLEIVKRLLQMPHININHLNAKNMSALAIASFDGNGEIVRLLLNHPFLRLYTYANAMKQATRAGHMSILEIFLEKFRKTEKARNYHNRIYRRAKHLAFIEACKCENFPIVKRLLEAGAELNRRGHDDKTPLMTAVVAGSLPLVEFFVKEKHIKLRRRNNFGDDELALAMREKQTDIFQFLFQKYHWSFSIEHMETLIRKLRSWNRSMRDPATERKYSKMARHITQAIQYRCLAQINTFGKFADGKSIPYLPVEIYRDLARFLKMDRTILRRFEPSPEDELDFEDRDIVLIRHNGLIFYKDLNTNTAFEKNAEGYLVESDVILPTPRRQRQAQ